MFKKIISVITIAFAAITYILFAVQVFFKSSYPTTGSKLLWIITLIAAPALVYLIYKFSNSIAEFLRKITANKTVMWLSLLGLTIIPRVIWILLFDIVPTADFHTNYSMASALAEKSMMFNDYVSVFPHVFGYPFVLSIFFRIFGNHIIVAQILNILFGCGIAAVLFLLGKRFRDEVTGYAAAVIWALWPSQIFYSVLVASETMFSLMLLATIYFFVRITQSRHGKSDDYFNFFVLGLLIALCNAVRPLGLVIFAAFSVYYFFAHDNRFLKKELKTKLVMFAVLAVSYFLCVVFISNLVGTRINRNIATRPGGYSLYVGMNREAKGAWNYKDSERITSMMNSKELSAQQIHNTLFQDAIKRFSDNKAGNIKLAVQKHSIMWGEDTDVLKYMKVAIDADKPSTGFFMKFCNLFSKISNLYYYVFLLLAAIGCIALVKKPSNAMYLPVLLLLLIALAHVLTEVAGRYHYPAVSLIAMIAAYGINPGLGFTNPGLNKSDMRQNT